MAWDLRTRSLLVRAAAGTTARGRFGNAESIAVALGSGLVIIRCLAFAVLGFTQFAGVEKTCFLATICSTIVALWTILTLFSATTAVARANPGSFFSNSSKHIRCWRMTVLFRRPRLALPLAVLVGALIAATLPAGGVDRWLAVWAVGAALACVGLVIIVSRGAKLGRGYNEPRNASLATLAIVLLAAAGPDFAITGGTMVPHLYGTAVSGASALLLPFLPAVLPLAGLVRLSIPFDRGSRMRVSRYGANMAGPTVLAHRRPRPIRAIFQRRFGHVYWATLFAASFYVGAVVDRAALPVILITAAGGLYGLLRMAILLSEIRDRWQADSPGRALWREVSVFCVASAGTHGVVAAAAIVVLWLLQ